MPLPTVCQSVPERETPIVGWHEVPWESAPERSSGGRAFFSFFHASQAFLQGSDQVDDVALGRLRSRSLPLLSLSLRFDQLLHLFGVSIPVFSRIKLTGHSFDQFGSQGHFIGRYLFLR